MATLLLAGATGLVGNLALARLLADPQITHIVAPTRRPLSPHPKLTNPIIDATTPLPPDADWWAVDAAICAIGTTRARTPDPATYRAIDHDYPLSLARLVRAAGATRCALVSSMGADARSRFAYTRLKGELEEALDRLAFPSLTIVRPGFLGGDRTEHRPIERIIAPLLRVAAPILPAAARISPAATVADFVIAGALHGPPGRHVHEAAEIARAADRPA